MADAKARLSALVAEVETGEEIALTRHGKVVARLVPDRPLMAADAFRDIWASGGIDIDAPEDLPPDDVATLDD